VHQGLATSDHSCVHLTHSSIGVALTDFAEILWADCKLIEIFLFCHPSQINSSEIAESSNIRWNKSLQVGTCISRGNTTAYSIRMTSEGGGQERLVKVVIANVNGEEIQLQGINVFTALNEHKPSHVTCYFVEKRRSVGTQSEFLS